MPITRRTGALVLLLSAVVSVAILLLLLGGCAVQPSTWSKETRIEESAYQALHAIDLVQTLRVARHPDKYAENELAWILGKHPSQRSVVLWYASTTLLHVGITAELAQDGAPPFIQRGWEVLSLIDVAQAVHGNYAIGLKWGF